MELQRALLAIAGAVWVEELEHQALQLLGETGAQFFDTVNEVAEPFGYCIYMTQLQTDGSKLYWLLRRA